MTFNVTWRLSCLPLLCRRYPSSQCSVSGLRWRVVWSLIWWKTGGSLQTLSSSTAGQLLTLQCQTLQSISMHLILGPGQSGRLVLFSFLSSRSASVCSTFGIDRDRVINQYITTLLLFQEDEGGDPGTGQEETQPRRHADTLERVLQIIPMLHNTSELTDSLCAAIFKVCASGTN